MCCAESRDVLEFSLPSGKSDILVIFSLIFLILPLKPIKGRFAVCDFSVVIWHITTSMMEIEHVLPPAPHSFLPCLLFWFSKEEPGFGACLSVEGMLQVSPPEHPFGEVFIPLNSLHIYKPGLHEWGQRLTTLLNFLKVVDCLLHLIFLICCVGNQLINFSFISVSK